MIISLTPTPTEQLSKEEWKILKNDVFQRDGKRCKVCKSRVKLSAHHIISREDGGGNNLENLVTLCERCHDKAELGELNLTEIRFGTSDIIRQKKQEIEMYIWRDGNPMFIGYRYE
jgi:hypothetical protein